MIGVMVGAFSMHLTRRFYPGSAAKHLLTYHSSKYIDLELLTGSYSSERQAWTAAAGVDTFPDESDRRETYLSRSKECTLLNGEKICPLSGSTL